MFSVVGFVYIAWSTQEEAVSLRHVKTAGSAPEGVVWIELPGRSFTTGKCTGRAITRTAPTVWQSEFFMRELAGSKHFKVTTSDIFLTQLCQVMSRRVQGCCACVEMSFHLRLTAKRETLSCVRTRIWQFSSTGRRNLTYKEEALRELGMPSYLKLSRWYQSQ